MPTNEVTLGAAAFLDSEHAAGLDVEPQDARRIVERFLACAYEDVGTAPKLLDAHDVHGIVGHLMPGRFKRKDPLAAQVPAVLRAWLTFLGETEVVPNLFEMRKSLEETLGEFQRTVETGENPHHHQREDPFVHKAAQTGRNDPCPCGSGKKFKKCHGAA